MIGFPSEGEKASTEATSQQGFNDVSTPKQQQQQQPTTLLFVSNLEKNVGHETSVSCVRFIYLASSE